MPQAIQASGPIKVSYKGRPVVERLLGKRGIPLMHKVLDLVRTLATTQRWPLVRVDVRAIRDPEVEGWEYVLLVPVFGCSFDIADGYLHQLYAHIDGLGASLSEDEGDLLRKLIFFDVETLTWLCRS